ncbi:hypothetical protein CKW00_00015 [Salimicrobium humidisoli]|uniref:mRNA interferase MazF n=2 Tax=Bacillaceae TaxID=186817 RepID=A0ABX4HV67_9BACI|nr:hypothetical protein CKW00_00015 [Salimicrobium humidisoli]
MNKTMQKLEGVIEHMDEKRGKIFIDWLNTQSTYLQWEEGFDPSYLKAYKRGEIVFAHFGFNVGAEYGGMHYAVVVSDSSKMNPNVNVIPMSSLEEGQTEEDIHKSRVFLGVINGLNDKKAMAIPDQLRPISKIRIVRPKKAKETVYKLNSEQMDAIDDKVRRMFTRLRSEDKKEK